MVTPQPCILLVDDDDALLQALPEALALRMPAIQVQVCVSAVEALERIRQYDYDAIISDIKMPGIDGLALLTRIKELRPETPTLLITGHGEHDLTIQALRGGAYDFIQKPLDRDYFVAALQRAIQAYGLRRQVREQQQTLERHAQSLEALVEERTRELVEANAAKDAFLGLASHELKTPLTSLKGMIQLLQRRNKHAEESLQVALANMERSIHRMEILVNDLLNTSLLDRGMFVLHTRPCDLTALCQHILDEYIAGTNLAVTLIAPPEPLLAEVDVDRISQVLLDLLSNAGKYSTRGAPITVTLERVGDKCIIAVQDQGIGIRADELPHIFARFYKVPDSERQTGSSVGLGLGLYITRKIVERHGGDIEVQSSPGSGSTFSVILPLAVDICASTQAQEDATPAPPMTSQARDDELEQRLRDSERQLAQLEAVFETMTDGVIVFDDKGHLLQMNRAACDFLGLDSQPDYSLHVALERSSPYEVRDEQSQFLSVEQWPLLRVLKGEVLTGATAMDVIIRARDGREVQLNVSGAPVRDQRGQIGGAVMVMRDVTERRHLEHRAQERTDEFLGIASHELRTPLTTIKGNIQLARMQLTKCLRGAAVDEGTLRITLAEIHTMLERAERQVNVQNRMVSDLLNLSRIQADKLELRLAPCDLAAIVREAVEDQRSAAPTRTIRMALAEEEKIPVVADAERIEQVVSNYLTNALKYSPEDRSVEVQLEKEGKMACVSVRDEGPGLTPSEQERVWEQYFRVPGITKQRGFSMGLGLGLYICRAIIEQHQGEVGVESTKGMGSTFWFTLPLAENDYPVAL